MKFQTLRFQAMGCPCEILLDTDDTVVGAGQLALAIQEAQRIETKYSRYLKGSTVDQINTSQGSRFKVDDETAALLDFATDCYKLSEGLFDITLKGWNHVTWERPYLQLPPDFAIDLGGICKEYAADRILKLLVENRPISTLVNLGGDIAAAGDRIWSVGIEDISNPGQSARTLYLKQGAVATSGTTKRAGHIRNPRTGRPVEQAPDSITVATRTCTEAGFWSTLAMLHGAGAEHFLMKNRLEHWCYRRSPSF